MSPSLSLCLSLSLSLLCPMSYAYEAVEEAKGVPRSKICAPIRIMRKHTQVASEFALQSQSQTQSQIPILASDLGLKCVSQKNMRNRHKNKKYLVLGLAVH